MLDYQHNLCEYFLWMRKVSNYVSDEYGVEVNLEGKECVFHYDPKQSTIEIEESIPPRDKLYALLHEVGHLSRIIENQEDSTFFMDATGSKNKKELTMTLIEEVLAWKKAEEIAHKMEIDIEERAWKRFVVKNVTEYINWIREI